MRRKDPGNHRSGSGGGTDDSGGGDAYDAIASILTPGDEAQYWADVANSAKKREEREKATSFYQTLEPISDEFTNKAMQLAGHIV